MKSSSHILFLFFLLLLFSCGIAKSVKHQPITVGYNDEFPQVTKHSDSLFTAGNNYLLLNKVGLWELYVAGDPLERGLMMGALYDSLYHYQEQVFFGKVQELVPSRFKQNMLRQFLKWYNRKLYKHVPEELKTEIYGVSKYATDEFDYLAPKYLRNLYLHAAHDIGHALQDLALVGCSSMALWGSKTTDGKLLLGRNFDFYVGDDFARNKVVSFVQPDGGHPFAMVGWPGMIGVVSGMNKQGLTITMNAGKSNIPLSAKAPISIVAREILQYASTIEEAVAIARSKKVFVSESLMVASSKDKNVVLIEVSPQKFGVYQVENSEQLLCSNHFQSESYEKDKNNQNHMIESHSKYRMDRMEELLSDTTAMTPSSVVSILRNTKGVEDMLIGYGNEKALNQMLGHHSVVFQPEDLLMWVSSSPYQLGEFVAYDLEQIFSKNEKDFVSQQVKEMNVPLDTFVFDQAFINYERFRIVDKEIDKALNEMSLIDEAFITEYQRLNPDLWSVYFKIGKYYFNQKSYKEAKNQFLLALTKEVTTLPDRAELEKYLKKSNKKLK